MRNRLYVGQTFIFALFSLLILTISIFILISTSCLSNTLVPVKSFYYYDKNAPLEAEVKEVSRSSSVVVYEVFYNSANNERISSLLTVPLIGKSPYPVLLYLHGSGMNREIPPQAVDIIAQQGYATFSLSIKGTNERKIMGKEITQLSFLDFRNMVVQTILDFRRGIDYLETRQDIDPKRIGVLGLSLGSIIGSTLFSVDGRIRAGCFAVGGGDLELLAQKSIIFGPTFDIRSLGINLQELKDLLAPVDPINFAKFSQGRPVLMVNGRGDQIIPPPTAKALYDRFGEPKHIIWFEGGHVPSMEVIMKLVKELLIWLHKFIAPHTLPIVAEEVNRAPRILSLKVKPEDTIRQGNIIRFFAEAIDEDKNIAFVKVYLESSDEEVVLFDDGRKPYDEKANDGIYSGKTYIPYESRTGESRITAYAVDYNGQISREISTTIDVLPYIPPEGTHPPEIVKVSLPSTIKTGQKIKIEVEVQDKDEDISEVVGEVVEYGFSSPLQKITSSKYGFELEIPEVVPEGTYHIKIWAKDRTKQKSKKEIRKIKVVK